MTYLLNPPRREISSELAARLRPEKRGNRTVFTDPQQRDAKGRFVPKAKRKVYNRKQIESALSPLQLRAFSGDDAAIKKIAGDLGFNWAVKRGSFESKGREDFWHYVDTFRKHYAVQVIESKPKTRRVQRTVTELIQPGEPIIYPDGTVELAKRKQTLVWKEGKKKRQATVRKGDVMLATEPLELTATIITKVTDAPIRREVFAPHNESFGTILSRNEAVLHPGSPFRELMTILRGMRSEGDNKSDTSPGSLYANTLAQLGFRKRRVVQIEVDGYLIDGYEDDSDIDVGMSNRKMV